VLLNIALVESVITTSKGTFRFKQPDPGTYFIVVHYRGISSIQGITVKEQKDTTPCWRQELVINREGKMQIYRSLAFDYGHD